MTVEKEKKKELSVEQKLKAFVDEQLVERKATNKDINIFLEEHVLSSKLFLAAFDEEIKNNSDKVCKFTFDQFKNSLGVKLLIYLFYLSLVKKGMFPLVYDQLNSDDPAVVKIKDSLLCFPCTKYSNVDVLITELTCYLGVDTNQKIEYVIDSIYYFLSSRCVGEKNAKNYLIDLFLSDGNFINLMETSESKDNKNLEVWQKIQKQINAING